MICAFIPKQIKYTGAQLAALWAYRNFGIQGDSLVAFVGPCRIPTRLMIDAEDVRAGSKIFSARMLHFIAEHFDGDLETAVLRQRLLAVIVKDELEQHLDYRLTRRGDDLYDPVVKNKPAKLSISIATASPVSTLIHFAINIDSKHTPVIAAGLNDYSAKGKINPEEFANKVMRAYVAEMHSIRQARQKVFPAHQ